MRPLGKRKRRIDDRQELPGVAAVARIRFRVFQDEDGRVAALREGVAERELKLLRGKRCEPGAILDLHGMRTSQVAAEVRDFLRVQQAKGVRTVLLVHGKGIHSEAGVGVLGEHLVKALTQGPVAGLVRALTIAEEGLGGRGAMVVQLTKVR